MKVHESRWGLLELGAIAAVFALRISGALPFPAWPFLLLIAAGFGVRPWRGFHTPGRASVAGTRVLIAAALIGVAYQFFTIFVEGPFLAWVFDEQETPPNVDGLVGNFLGLLGFLVLVTVFSIGEELAFRGYLLHRLRHWMGKTPLGTAAALLISSVAFGAMHTWQNLPGITGTVISGVLFGTVYVWSGYNIRAPVVTHLAVNVTGVFLAYFGLFLS